jgi:uncharacterized protein (DUF302 family)
MGDAKKKKSRKKRSRRELGSIVDEGSHHEREQATRNGPEPSSKGGRSPAAARPATGQDAQVTIKSSPRSVDETVSRLEDLLQSKGVKLFAVIDHSGEAAAVDLALRETKVVIFGSPVAGTPVMAAVPLAALDLPLKVLVWADGEATKLAYAGPAALAARYGLSDELASRLGSIDALTDAVVAS